MSIFRCEYHDRSEDSDWIEFNDLQGFYHEFPGIDKLFIKNGITNKYDTYCLEGFLELAQDLIDISDLTDYELGYYQQILDA